MNPRTKLIGTIVLGAALLVPTAEARIPDDGGVMRGPGGIAALQVQAPQHPDNRALRGPGGIAALQVQAPQHPDNRAQRRPGGVATVAQTVPVRPDDRAGLRGPGAFDSGTSGAATHPDNRAEARGPGAFTTEVVQPARDGFDWSDALIGGIGGIGLGLLLTGCLFLLLSQRQRMRMA